MANAAKTNLNLHRSSFVQALIVSTILVSLLCIVLNPRWETNDDVGMSMIAHGYGLVDYGSPNLIFSNVIWGYFVRTIPEVIGVNGYAITMLWIVALSGAIIFWTLVETNSGLFISFSVLIIILFRSVLFPQFTITSGLSMVGAVLCFYLYGLNHDWKILIGGCLMAYVAYLIRSQQALLVFIVSFPFLPWKGIVLGRVSKFAFVSLFAIIFLSVVVDRSHYSNDEWSYFNDINIARAPYTDFGAGSRLLSRQDIYEKYGYSKNDVSLISSWGVYADPQLAEPKKLRAMLSEMGFLANNKLMSGNVLIALKTLFHASLAPIFFTAIFFLFIKPNARLILVWSIFIIVISALGLLGRPGVMRVYYPLISLLLVFSLICNFIEMKSMDKTRKYLIIVVFIGLLINSYNVVSESRAATQTDELVRRQLDNFPDVTVLVWGSGFPYEAVYPVIGIPPAAMKFRLYGFGVFSPAPFSVASSENKNGRGMARRFISDTGMPIIANDGQVQILGTYCSERLHGDMEMLAVKQYGPALVRVLHCEVRKAVNQTSLVD